MVPASGALMNPSGDVYTETSPSFLMEQLGVRGRSQVTKNSGRFHVLQLGTSSRTPRTEESTWNAFQFFGGSLSNSMTGWWFGTWPLFFSIYWE